MRLRRILALAALLLAAAAVAGVAQPRLGRGADAPADRTITVTGSGAVSAVPDRASFDFGVQARAATATQALADAAKAAAAVIAALKGAGVVPADLATTQVSLSPNTTRNGNRIVGYTASSDVSAHAALAKAGPIVDGAVRAGATSVSGPSLELSNQDALYRQALERAVADAKAKAQTLANAGGLQLGALRSVTEQSSGAPSPLPVNAKASSGGVPIEPGTQEVDASVTAVFAAG